MTATSASSDVAACASNPFLTQRKDPDMDLQYSAKCYVDGEWTDGAGGSFDTVSPATGALLTRTPAADEGLASRAIAAARVRFDDGSWSGSTGRDRRRMLM